MERELIDKDESLFNCINTATEVEVQFELKPNTHRSHKKDRLILVHLRNAVSNEVKKLKKHGHFEKVHKHKASQSCFLCRYYNKEN